MSISLYLPDREECYELFREARFGETVTCIECGSDYVIKRGTSSRGAQRYQCKDCGNYFNDLSDTLFERHRLAIEQIAYIMHNRGHNTAEELADALEEDTSVVKEFLEQIGEGDDWEYIKVLTGPDFSLLMAGDMLSPFVGEDDIDPQSGAFTQWIMKLAYEE